jgi:hypothetical protein
MTLDSGTDARKANWQDYAMLAVAPTVVHVVTSGTDWLSLAAVISTGIVGIAGIASTAWQASKRSDQQDRREALAQRRRIYAEYLGAIHRMTRPAFDVDIAFQTKDTERITLTTDILADLETRAEVTLGQLRLVASPVIVSIAEWLLDLTRFPSAERKDTPTWFDSYQDLTNAMRADLGYPPLPRRVEITIEVSDEPNEPESTAS